MSGHSKWSTIKRQKGVTDIKRGQTFTKLANAITIAVKIGGSGDPDSNPRLRVAVDAAKSVNMPKENIKRATDRGLDKLPGQALEEMIYEGYGPGKVAFLIEAVTDNKMRTLQGVKNIFERNGGSLVGQGSVAYMFDRAGEIKVKSQDSNAKLTEDEMLELIDLGAIDVKDYIKDGIQMYLVYVESPELNTMGNKITQAGYEVESKELVFKPNTLISINDAEKAKKVLDFFQRIEDLDDVQKVYANFNIEEKLI
ncbi:YebC/PmpR family DNA-binding transcriptional regulator [Patescibacteria group bacterium]|nr:YebC/PmpR family DNA-binding transcriptional regulator [Patescibacteria group bacterium]